MSAIRLFRILSGTLWMLFLSACTTQTHAADPVTQQTNACSIQVIVAFSSDAHNPPDKGLVRDVARTAGVNLTYVRSVNAELHVFVVTAAGADPDCSRALERLRADSRIRSVDVDQRRTHH